MIRLPRSRSSFPPRLSRALRLAPLLALAAADAPPKAPPALSPAEIVAAAPTEAWRDIPAEELVVMTLAGGRRIVIQLAPSFSPGHTAAIRALAKAHWWDGTSIYRVQDGYVAQWGDRPGTKPLPAGMAGQPQAYTLPWAQIARETTRLPWRDTYAGITGFWKGWPVGSNGKDAWLTHCYATVGVGREEPPDAGTGAELYAVIGHAPRALDRNIAVVGRVVQGMENLSSLPRGTAEIGMYAPDQPPTPILSVRLATELAEVDRPHLQMLDVASPAFGRYMKARADRRDPFYLVGAGAADICNIPLPVRTRP